MLRIGFLTHGLEKMSFKGLKIDLIFMVGREFL